MPVGIYLPSTEPILLAVHTVHWNRRKRRNANDHYICPTSHNNLPTSNLYVPRFWRQRRHWVRVLSTHSQIKSDQLPNRATYKSSFTFYGAGDTFGSPNCNTNTAACGFYTSPGFSAAASENIFGVGPGAVSPAHEPPSPSPSLLTFIPSA